MQVELLKRFRNHQPGSVIAIEHAGVAGTLIEQGVAREHVDNSEERDKSGSDTGASRPGPARNRKTSGGKKATEDCTVDNGS